MLLDQVMIMSQCLQALIFDVDGTLADTERHGHRVAFNRAFDEAGLDWFWDEVRYGQLLAVTGGKERIWQYVMETQPDWLQEPDSALQIRELHAAKTRHYVELIAQGAIPLRPGVVRLLQEAEQAGLRLAIATTTTPENVTALLSATLGTTAVQRFAVIAAGDVVPAKKPAPDIFCRVLKQMQLPADACLVFEDSDNGVRAACAADLGVIVTTNGYTHNQDFSGAQVVLDGLGEPGQPPVRVQWGTPPPKGYVDLAALRDWHAAMFA